MSMRFLASPQRVRQVNQQGPAARRREPAGEGRDGDRRPDAGPATGCITRTSLTDGAPRLCRSLLFAEKSGTVARRGRRDAHRRRQALEPPEADGIHDIGRSLAL